MMSLSSVQTIMATKNPFVDRATLRRLDLGERLGGTELEELARKVRVEELPAGRHLFVRAQSDAWTYYLLSGDVVLRDAAGVERTVTGGSEEARHPLGDEQPRQHTATASSPVTFIRIHRSLLEVLGGRRNNGAYEVEEISAGDSDVDNRLFFELYHAYMSNSLELPHLPDVATRVRSAAEDPDTDFTRIARIIQSDPLLAAELIQAANSPLYGVQTPITTARGAVSLLGLETTRHLVLTYTLRGLFKTESSILRHRMEALWRHSALTGALCFALAERTHGLDAERAMIAGLLHDIGALPVIHYASRFPELASDAAHLEQAIVDLKGQIGAMLLRRWGFGDEMVQVVLECDQWLRDPDPRPDNVDAVIVAQYIGAGPDERQWLPPRETVPAFTKLCLEGLDEATEAEISARARHEIAEELGLF